MHGNIVGASRPVGIRRDAATGAIDFDRYRALAHTPRDRAAQRAMRRFAPLALPPMAVAALAAAIRMMPSRAEDCPIRAQPPSPSAPIH